MSINPTGLLTDPTGGVFTVIDNGPDYDDVLLIPGSFNHRQVVRRDELAHYGEYHAARVAPPAEEDDLARIEIAYEALRTLAEPSRLAAMTWLRDRLAADAADREAAPSSEKARP